MEPSVRQRSTLPTIVTVVAALACVVVVVLWNAPANWLAEGVASRTGGVVLLADAEGSIWSGSAVLGLGGPAGSAGPGPRFALPGRIIWKTEWGGSLAPVLHLTHDGVLQQPVAVRYANGEVVFDAGTAVLPAAILELVGPPLNTLRPEGRCIVRWQTLAIDQRGNVTGTGTLRVGGFALALSTVRPLGDYLVDWVGNADGLTWRLATEGGPLEVVGNGTIAAGTNDARGAQARVVVRTAATASAAIAVRLAPLLDMIGRRGTNEAVIEIGRSQ